MKPDLKLVLVTQLSGFLATAFDGDYHHALLNISMIAMVFLDHIIQRLHNQCDTLLCVGAFGLVALWHSASYCTRDVPRFPKQAVCTCLQAIETFMSLGVDLISVSMNYTAPADAIYNIILSKTYSH